MNNLTVRTYKYRGTHNGPDLFDAVQSSIRVLQPCGTDPAWRRHMKRGETPCEPCVEAHQAYNKQKNKNRGGPRELRPCGTTAAYARHKRAGEDPCDECVEAFRSHWRENRALEKEARI